MTRALRPRFLCSLALAALAAGGLAGFALASTASPVLRTTMISTPNEVVLADGHGRTVYELSPETAHHLLCRSRACFEVWPPLTVKSRSVKLLAGHGVSGHLGLLRRSSGKLQVTLNGKPVYRYAADVKGEANGDGIMSFGGTWHTIRAAGSPPAPTMTTTTSTPTTPPPAPPQYQY